MDSKVNCYHCGDNCGNTVIEFEEKNFCCNGCKTVYEIFSSNDLSYYYDLQSAAGATPKSVEGKYDFLDNNAIVERLTEFNDGDLQIVNLYIPNIHCSSCIWVLENLNKLDLSINSSQVDFPKKSVRITYKTSDISLKKLVILLARIGYEPYISLDDYDKKKKSVDRSLIYKLGVAGFAFGNVMFLFSLPVVFYAGQDYFISAYKGLRSKLLNIDVPIALGVFVLFVRSPLEIIFDW